MTDPDMAARDLQLLLDKYAPHLRPGTDYRPPIPAEIKRTTVFRLHIQSWSGKRKEAEADFSGGDAGVVGGSRGVRGGSR